MVFADYFSWNRAKHNTEELKKKNPQDPVLNEQDEQFLHRITSNDEREPPLPPLPERPAVTQQDADATKDAENAALPDDAARPETNEQQAPDGTTPEPVNASKRTWGSYVPSVPSVPSMPSMPSMPAMPSMPRWSADNSKSTNQGNASGEAEQSAAKLEKVDEKPGETAPYPPGVKVTENISDDDDSDDHKEVTVLLDKLNLSSINNRVFAFSTQTQQIYKDFTVVLKDMINGVPTAYDDMDRLLRNNEGHLSDMFADMPPFVQTLVKSIPTSIAPTILSAASKPDSDLSASTSSSAKTNPDTQPNDKKTDLNKDKQGKKSSAMNKIPSLKGMTQQKGAVATMLTNIVNFLKLRFPLAITGPNVVMSMAVLILLFVMFYCRKRGKEMRLERAEAASASASASGSDDDEHEDGEEEGLGVQDVDEKKAEADKEAGEGHVETTPAREGGGVDGTQDGKAVAAAADTN